MLPSSDDVKWASLTLARKNILLLEIAQGFIGRVYIEGLSVVASFYYDMPLTVPCINMTAT